MNDFIYNNSGLREGKNINCPVKWWEVRQKKELNIRIKKERNEWKRREKVLEAKYTVWMYVCGKLWDYRWVNVRLTNEIISNEVSLIDLNQIETVYWAVKMIW